MGEELSVIFPDLLEALKEPRGEGLLTQYGQWLLGVLGVIAVAWAGITTVLRDDPLGVAGGQIFRILMVSGFTLWLIRDDGAVLHQLAAGFEDVAAIINPTGGDITAALGQMFHTAFLVFQNSHDSGFVERLAGMFQDGVLAAFLYKIGTSLLILIAAGVYAGVYVYADLLITIAIVIAPLSLPFWLISPLSFVATGWMRFAVTAGMTKVLAAIVLMITSDFVERVRQMVMDAQDAQGWSHFSAYSGAMLLMIILAIVMAMIPALANNIVSGGISNLSTAGATAAARTAGRGMPTRMPGSGGGSGMPSAGKPSVRGGR